MFTFCTQVAIRTELYQSMKPLYSQGELNSLPPITVIPCDTHASPTLPPPLNPPPSIKTSIPT